MTPEKLAALADCPFCGEPGYVREIDYGPAAFRVECSEGCCAMEVWNEDQASAITAWNIRTLPQGYAAGVEAAAWMDDLANAIGGLLSRSNNLSGPEANTFTHPNVLALIRRYAALSSADAVVAPPAVRGK